LFDFTLITKPGKGRGTDFEKLFFLGVPLAGPAFFWAEGQKPTRRSGRAIRDSAFAPVLFLRPQRFCLYRKR